jgi:hypothetical protein
VRSRNAIGALAAAVAVFAVACDKDTPTTPTTPSVAVSGAALHPVEGPPQPALSPSEEPLSLSAEYCLINTPIHANADAHGVSTPEGRRQLAILRATVAHLTSADDALAAGFSPSASGCLQGAGARGAFGRQLIIPARAFDDVLDPSLPEVVAYEDQADGSTKLVNVFHTIPAGPGYTPILASQFSGPPYPSPRPELYGRPFDGPLVQPSTGFVFWGLRVHVGRHNPNGLFHPYNPGVSCEYSPHTTILDPLACWFPE